MRHKRYLRKETGAITRIRERIFGLFGPSCAVPDPECLQTLPHGAGDAGKAPGRKGMGERVRGPVGKES